MNNRAWYVQSRPIIREGSLEGTGIGILSGYSGWDLLKTYVVSLD